MTIRGVTSNEPSSSFDLLASSCSPVAKGFFLSNLILKSINSHLNKMATTLYNVSYKCLQVASIFFSFPHTDRYAVPIQDQRNCLAYDHQWCQTCRYIVWHATTCFCSISVCYLSYSFTMCYVSSFILPSITSGSNTYIV